MTKVKRGEMKARRQKQRMAQRRAILLGIVGAVILLIALIAIPNLIQQNQPIGEIKTVEPRAYPAAGDGTFMGDPNAPVKIEVFEDFQCPACKNFGETTEARIVTEMKDLIESGKVYYHFRHYPFIDDRSATRESDQAANASMCAAEQGKFWQMKETIFGNWDGENQGSFTSRRLKAMAETVGLDMNQFNSCFDDNKYQKEINSDLAAGKKLNVTYTPTMFINGQNPTPGSIPSFEELTVLVNNILNSQ